MECCKFKSKKIRQGDRVIAIAGNDRGKTGTVLRCDGERVVVQGLNIRKRHTKGTRERPGGIIPREAPMHISNLRVCPDGKSAAKLFIKSDDAGERTLCYTVDGKDVVYRSVKEPYKS